MSKLETLNDLLIEEIQDLYSAESQIIAALPKMAQAATDRKLRQAFEDHLEQTKEHKRRLEEVCRLMNQRPNGRTCKAMKGLLEEAEELLKEDTRPEVLDAGIIACAQRVEHYEIAGYGCVRTFAQRLGLHDVEQLLQTTLNEEAAADEKLTQIAERDVNREAIRA